MIFEIDVSCSQTLLWCHESDTPQASPRRLRFNYFPAIAESYSSNKAGCGVTEQDFMTGLRYPSAARNGPGSHGAELLHQDRTAQESHAKPIGRVCKSVSQSSWTPCIIVNKFFSLEAVANKRTMILAGTDIPKHATSNPTNLSGRKPFCSCPMIEQCARSQAGQGTSNTTVGLSQNVVARKSKKRMSHRAGSGIAQKQSGARLSTQGSGHKRAYILRRLTAACLLRDLPCDIYER